MNETQCWEVDRLAARRILSRLKIKATPAIVEEIAVEFAEHRKDAEQRVTNRVQSNIIRVLEERSMQDFGQMDGSWAQGFRTAEEVVATLSPNDLLDQPSGKAKSKGQVLRSMVRVARKRSAIVERRSR